MMPSLVERATSAASSCASSGGDDSLVANLESGTIIKQSMNRRNGVMNWCSNKSGGARSIAKPTGLAVAAIFGSTSPKITMEKMVAIATPTSAAKPPGILNMMTELTTKKKTLAVMFPIRIVISTTRRSRTSCNATFAGGLF